MNSVRTQGTLPALKQQIPTGFAWLCAVALGGVLAGCTGLPQDHDQAPAWGLVCLSVATGREQPAHPAEMGTQELMGHSLRVWKRAGNWCLVQTADRYVSWMEEGSFRPCTAAEVDAWNQSPLLIVTAFEDRVLENPHPGAQPVTDVVMGCLVKKTGEAGDWYQVELSDRRAGYLPTTSAQDYAAWQQSHPPTPENIERTARSLLGRPYLWGANSPKAFDCSGFTKFVFFLNGVRLDRNASQQARQGTDIPLDARLSHLRKGDLLFFGRRGRHGRPERVVHTGIYLGERLFIHASDRVRISSLDPVSPLRDEHRLRTLIRARRLLPPAAAQPCDLIIRNGLVIDGTGAPARPADVGIRDGRIVAIGRIAGETAEEIDATGLVATPGFIDVHTHADDIDAQPLAENLARMGVTTVVAGNCGESTSDVAALLRRVEQNGASVNVATLVGHSTVREAAMGGSFDRPPTRKELARMQAHVD